MRLSKHILLARCLLEHLHIGPYAESLAGDLEENLRAGRSARWYWRQVLSAIGMDALTLLRAYAVPVVFSAGWSTLYPAWMVAGRGGRMQAMLERSTSYSTSLDLASGIIPALVFLWLGFFLYQIYASLRARGRGSFDGSGAGSPVGWLQCAAASDSGFAARCPPLILDLRFTRLEDFYASAHVAAIHTHLALSLFASILCARPLLA